MDILKNPDLPKTTDDAAVLIFNREIDNTDGLQQEETDRYGPEPEDFDGDVALTLQVEREELASQVHVIQERARVREDNSARDSRNNSLR
jgi:hypothetical protein